MKTKRGNIHVHATFEDPTAVTVNIIHSGMWRRKVWYKRFAGICCFYLQPSTLNNEVESSYETFVSIYQNGVTSQKTAYYLNESEIK